MPPFEIDYFSFQIISISTKLQSPLKNACISSVETKIISIIVCFSWILKYHSIFLYQRMNKNKQQKHSKHAIKLYLVNQEYCFRQKLWACRLYFSWSWLVHLFNRHRNLVYNCRGQLVHIPHNWFVLYCPIRIRYVNSGSIHKNKEIVSILFALHCHHHFVHFHYDPILFNVGRINGSLGINVYNRMLHYHGIL